MNGRLLHRLRWTCSDFVHHEHRWRWSATLCGRRQQFSFRVRVWTLEWRYRLRGAWRSLKGDYPI